MVTFAQARTQKLAAIESAIAQAFTADSSCNLDFLWQQWAQLQTSGEGGSASGATGSGSSSLSPLGNGVEVSAPAEGNTSASLDYESGAVFARIQVVEGQIRFANGETPSSASLIFTAGTNDVIALESAAQIQNFRFTALGAGTAAIAIQQYG